MCLLLADCGLIESKSFERNKDSHHFLAKLTN